jgi:RNA polymerase sigma factor (sigma-70 family)
LKAICPPTRYHSHSKPPANDAEELQLLAVAKEQRGTTVGNDAAARVLARHRGLLVNWCEFVIIGGFDLDDLLQECHRAGLDAIRYFKPEKRFKFSTYLMDCVRRAVARYMKDRRAQPLKQEGEDESLDMCPATDRGRGERNRADLAAVLGELDEVSAQVIQLRHGVGVTREYTFHGIAARLKIPAKEAERRYTEGMNYLRDEAAADALAV